MSAGAAESPTRAPSSRRVLSRPGIRWGLGLLAAVAAAVGAVYIFPTIEAAAGQLVGADPLWVTLAAASEAASLVAFAVLHRRLLRAAGVRVRLRDVTLVTLAANALHLSVPGGAALSTAYHYRRRRLWGASGPVATWSLVAGGVAASLALAAIALGSAFVVGGLPTSVPWLLLQVVGVAAVGVLVAVVSRRPAIIVRAGSAGLRLVNRLLRRPRETGVRNLAEQIAGLQLITLPGLGQLEVGLGALANWLFHIGCLAACCTAVGAHGMTLSLVLVAYAAATAASSATLLPGGLGLVDGALLAALVAGGVPSHPALAAVLLYRLITFIGVVAVGWGAWLLVHSRSDDLDEVLDAPVSPTVPVGEHDPSR